MDHIYLTNAIGETTGYGSLDVDASDYDKVPFEEGPGVVLAYLVEANGTKHVLGNLEICYRDAWWLGDDADLPSREDADAACERLMEQIKGRLKDRQVMLPLCEDMPARFVVGVAIPLADVTNRADCLAQLREIFGEEMLRQQEGEKKD